MKIERGKQKGAKYAKQEKSICRVVGGEVAEGRERRSEVGDQKSAKTDDRRRRKKQRARGNQRSEVRGQKSEKEAWSG